MTNTLGEKSYLRTHKGGLVKGEDVYPGRVSEISMLSVGRYRVKEWAVSNKGLLLLNNFYRLYFSHLLPEPRLVIIIVPYSESLI